MLLTSESFPLFFAEGVYKYFLKFMWTFLFSWVAVYPDKDKWLAVMSVRGSKKNGIYSFMLFSEYTFWLTFILFKLVNQSQIWMPHHQWNSTEITLRSYAATNWIIFCNAQNYLSLKYKKHQISQKLKT